MTPLVLGAVADVMPPDEAFNLAVAHARRAPDAAAQKVRLLQLGRFKNPEVVPLVEAWWQQPEVQSSRTLDWCPLVAEAGLAWPTARRWLERGRPLALIALDVLSAYHTTKSVPANFQCPAEAELRAALQAYLQRDNVPRTSKTIQALLADPAPLR